jgi:hypothetical protein
MTRWRCVGAREGFEMKIVVLAGLFTAAAIPFAGAAEASAECQVDDTRRTPQVRIDGGGPGGSAPAPTVARTTAAPRATPADQIAQREAAEAAREAAERRRSGKRIPDAELIGPRGAL